MFSEWEVNPTSSVKLIGSLRILWFCVYSGWALTYVTVSREPQTYKRCQHQLTAEKKTHALFKRKSNPTQSLKENKQKGVGDSRQEEQKVGKPLGQPHSGPSHPADSLLNYLKENHGNQTKHKNWTTGDL